MKLTTYRNKVLPQTSHAESRKEEFARKLAAMRMATGKAERFVTACACALHDRPFTVVYERTNPQQPFTIAGIYKNEGGNGAGGTSRPRTLAAHEIDSTGWRCPWCGDATTIMQCTSCRTTVCGGRVKRAPGAEPVFQCRPSCGARSTMTDAETVTGTDDRLRQSTARRPVSPSRPALPREPDRLLLERKK